MTKFGCFENLANADIWCVSSPIDVAPVTEAVKGDSSEGTVPEPTIADNASTSEEGEGRPKTTRPKKLAQWLASPKWVR